MDSTILLTILIGIAIIGGLYYVLTSRSVKDAAPAAGGDKDNNHTGLRLQAYERLTLLVDRISLPNLVGRTPADGLTARDMQFVLTRNIRDEFEYNITQQIYVSEDVWNAVKGLKEKNLLLVNQAAAALPADASGVALQRAILEFLVTDQHARLPELVSQALSFEAKKLM